MRGGHSWWEGRRGRRRFEGVGNGAGDGWDEDGGRVGFAGSLGGRIALAGSWGWRSWGNCESKVGLDLFRRSSLVTEAWKAQREGGKLCPWARRGG